MGYAKYVGRVGALAFALGLGAAVATSTPGIAFAEEPEPNQDPGTNQSNENNPADPSPSTPNPSTEPTPPPGGETPPPGENNQQQQQQNNNGTTPSGGEVRTAEPGEVLNTGGYQEEEKKPEEKIPEPTVTPPVVYVPPTPPVVTPKDQTIPQAFLIEKGKSKDTQLQQGSGNKLKTSVKNELSRVGNEEGNGSALQRGKSLTENTESFDTDNVMTTFSSGENENQQVVQTMAAAAAPASRPTLTSVLTGFLALVGLGPSTGAGTPSLPFVPQPIFDAIFAFVRRIESTLSNQTPTATVIPRQDPTNGQITGQVKGADEDGDTLTYALSSKPVHGQVNLDPKTGVFTYTPDNLDDTDPTTWKQDSFKITVSDNSGFHIHPQGESHTTEVTVNVLPPQAPTNPPASDGTVAGQITGVNNPSGGPVTYVVQTQPGSTEQLNVTPTGAYTYKPSAPLAHGAALDTNDDGEPDNPVFQTFTVIATDQDGNQTPIVLKLPVTPSNADPVPLPPAQQTAPQPTQGGGYSGTIGVNPDPDGDPVKIVSAVASDGTPVTFNGLNWTYGEPSGARASEPQGFAPFAAMRSLLGFDEGSSARQSDTGFSTLAAGDPVMITFTLSDGHGGVVPYQVTLPAADETPVDVSVGGAPLAPVVTDVAPDRAYQITNVKDDPATAQNEEATYLTMIDTRSGQAIGDGPISLPGKIRTGVQPQSSPDKSHLFVTTQVENQATGDRTTYVTVIDTQTGEVVSDDPVALAGQSDQGLIIKGNRAYVNTYTYDPVANGSVAHIAIFDTESGELVGGEPIDVVGGNTFVVGGNDRAYVTGYDFLNDQTRVTIIDTTNGDLVDDGTIVASGQENSVLVLDDDHQRAYFTTRSTTSNQAVWVGAVDTINGRLVGAPVEIDGAANSQRVVVSDDGSRAYVLTSAGDTANGVPTTTTVTVINAADGTGSTLKTVDGWADYNLVLGPGGRVYVATNAAESPGYFSTTTTAIDSTGAVVDTATTNGTPLGGPTLSANGRTVYQVISGFNSDTNTSAAYIAVFDASTGTAIGDPVEVPGQVVGAFTNEGPHISEVGDHLYVTTEEYVEGAAPGNADDMYKTRIASIDTRTGQLVGDPVEVEGKVTGRMQVAGDRVYQQTSDRWKNVQTTRVVVIDAATGKLVDGSSPIVLSGLPDQVGASTYSPLVFDGAGNAYQVTTFNNGNGTYTVRVAVIDGENGTLLGAEPLIVTQQPVGKVLDVRNADHAYLTINTTGATRRPPS